MNCPRARRALACLVAIAAAGLAAGACTMQNPEWATSTNPCCGQDLMAKGITPPEDRCADMVVDQDTARHLMMSLAGSAASQWHVRLIPGGPACIWRVWPGVSREDFREARPPEAGDEEAGNGAGADSTAPEPDGEPE